MLTYCSIEYSSYYFSSTMWVIYLPFPPLQMFLMGDAGNHNLPGGYLSHHDTREYLKQEVVFPVLQAGYQVSVLRLIWRFKGEELQRAWYELTAQRQVIDDIICADPQWCLAVSSINGMYSHANTGRVVNPTFYPSVTYWVAHRQPLQTSNLSMKVHNAVRASFSSALRNTNLTDPAKAIAALCRVCKDHRSVFMENKLRELHPDQNHSVLAKSVTKIFLLHSGVAGHLLQSPVYDKLQQLNIAVLDRTQGHGSTNTVVHRVAMSREGGSEGPIAQGPSLPNIERMFEAEIDLTWWYWSQGAFLTLEVLMIVYISIACNIEYLISFLLYVHGYLLLCFHHWKPRVVMMPILSCWHQTLSTWQPRCRQWRKWCYHGDSGFSAVILTTRVFYLPIFY